MVSSITSLDLTNEENMLLFVCSKAVEFNLVKLETSSIQQYFSQLQVFSGQCYKIGKFFAALAKLKKSLAILEGFIYY